VEFFTPVLLDRLTSLDLEESQPSNAAAPELATNRERTAFQRDLEVLSAETGSVHVDAQALACIDDVYWGAKAGGCSRGGKGLVEKA
jgi:hypothetical protein